MLKPRFRAWLSDGLSASAVLTAGIFAGSLIGFTAPSASLWLEAQVNHTLLALVSLLFFGIRFDALSQVLKHGRFLALAITANFLIIPLIGYALASLLLSTHPLFCVGLVIYFMAPCTDWFLSFTKLAKGNIALGTALIPINMVLQLLLYPIFLGLFAQSTVQIEASVIGNTLVQWFLLPLALGLVAHQIIRQVLSSERFEHLLRLADEASLWITAVLIMQIFAGNLQTILTHISIILWIVLAVLCFVLIVFLFSGGISRLCRFEYPERALLCMTLASRNAPLMLAVTVVAIPNQPLIYAVLVIAMLAEIPHLTALRYLLLRVRKN